MKKICLIIHSLGIGGMERVMAQLANNFAVRPGIQVDIILIGRSRRISYPLSADVKVHKPPFTFADSRRQMDTVRTGYFLRKEVKKIDPDVVLSFGEIWNNLVLLALNGLDIPVFISDRSEPGKDLGRLHNLLRTQLYPRAAGYIAQTKEAQNVCLSQSWNSNTKVIGNPIRQISYSREPVRENVVLSVGRLIPTKHFDQLIEVFASIGLPGWKLMIVGGDAKQLELSKELTTLVHELGVADSVFLEGEQHNIDSYYLRSKIFAFMSSSEGFPNVIGEALSAGLPAVAYDCVAGPSEMIEDGSNGFLVPLHNKGAFKHRLYTLMMNEYLRTKFAKQADISVEKFSIDEVADQYLSFLFDYQPAVMA